MVLKLLRLLGIKGSMNMATSEYARIIRLIIDTHDDGCYAMTSPSLPGLLLAGKDLNALLMDVPSAIKLLYKLNYQMDVDVRPATEELPRTAKTKPSGWRPLTPSFVAQPQHVCA